MDDERTLPRLETFLDQYRALLASMTSGVTYVATTCLVRSDREGVHKGARIARPWDHESLPRLLPISGHRRGCFF